MERRFEEKTVRKALQRGYVDAQRLLASPSQMQKFLLRLEEKEEVVRTVGEPLAAVPVLERLLRRYLDGEYTAISAAAMAQVVSALLYFVSPWDLYPDSVPGKGYADDARCAGLLLEALPAGTGGLPCLGERTVGLPERIGWGVKIRQEGIFP